MERPTTPAVEVRRWNNADPDIVYSHFIQVRQAIRPLKAVQIVHRNVQLLTPQPPSWEFCCIYRPEGAPVAVAEEK